MSVHAPIVTLTMNPALDVSSSTEHVVPEHKLRCGPSRYDPGGGGVNVSRAIRNLGGTSVAVYPLGGPTGQAYRGFIEAEGIVGRVIPIEGDTRQSFTVDELSTGEQFRFVLQGPELRDAEWRECLSVVRAMLPTGGYLVASGSLPPGVPDDFYARLALLADEHDVRLAVDASGPALEGALAEGVHLVKPSLRELGELVGATSSLDERQQVAAAQELVGEGRAEIVALSLGAAGAVLVTAYEVLRLPSPRVDVRSAVGAGDAFVAGFVLRLAEGRTAAEAFRTAVAAGSATAMLPATGLCRADDVARLERELAERAA